MTDLAKKHLLLAVLWCLVGAYNFDWLNVSETFGYISFVLAGISGFFIVADIILPRPTP